MTGNRDLHGRKFLGRARRVCSKNIQASGSARFRPALDEARPGPARPAVPLPIGAYAICIKGNIN